MRRRNVGESLPSTQVPADTLLVNCIGQAVYLCGAPGGTAPCISGIGGNLGPEQACGPAGRPEVKTVMPRRSRALPSITADPVAFPRPCEMPGAFAVTFSRLGGTCCSAGPKPGPCP